GSVCGSRNRFQHADTPLLSGLLRARCERPRRRPTDERDELAPSHSMTSSAIESGPGGMVSPSDLAVLRLMTKSNLVGCNTGMSSGVWPLRRRPTKTPACGYGLARLIP